ncbi:UNVERIFIED_CONTAM: Retrovirus-related Pol polyprotein from transposon RE2 [Sesamum latifolium]|uniref:Retrovirus-related Pol polyprotein from transposon RE2 n=1 Tax=Sesamum latifolium TaxID=2727402 RepID=A0AAW2XQM2_9LAMI
MQEPRNYYQASNYDKWFGAMNQEFTALEKNDTWDVVELAQGKKTIGSRWVCKLKLNPDGSVQRHKARLVAKGYNQIEATKWWPLLQLDINNAFLHGHLGEKVYIVPPEGYVLTVPGQCPHDHCFFLKITPNCFVASLAYVDEIFVTGNSNVEIVAVKSHLDTLFTIKDIGHAKYFLSLELARSAHGLLVTQQKYLHDIIRDAHLLDSKSAPTPLPHGLKLTADDGTLLVDPSPFRRLVGRHLYLGFTRPDVSFAINN